MVEKTEDTPMTDEQAAEKLQAEEFQQEQNQQPAAAAEPPKQSISGMVDQGHVNQIMEMGFSKVVAEKSLFMTQSKGVEKAMDWIYQNSEQPDFEEELFIVGQAEGSSSGGGAGADPNKPKLSKEEALKKAAEL